MAIFAPALARPSAIARPIPLFPPVTIATLPFSDIALLLFHGTERLCHPRPLVPSNDARISRRRAPGSDAPCARERAAWIQPDQGVPGPKSVRRAGHGLDGKAAPAAVVGQRVAREEHQIAVALVDPEREAGSVVRIPELDTSEAILVPYEVGECVVERRRADLPRLPEIVFRVLHGFPADRKAALVGPQDASRGRAHHQTIDSCGPGGEIRMSAAPVGTRVCADIRGRCPHPEAAVRQRIFDAEPEREGVTRLRKEDVLHHDPVWLAGGGGPGGPADEAVDRVVVLRLVQRELVAATVELVAAILQPVRPRD